VPTASANFLSRASAPATITLDGDRTVAGMRFDNAGHSYSIVPGSGGRLTLDSPGATPAVVEVRSGAHHIAAPLVLADNAAFSIAQGSSLSLSGGVSGNGTSLTKSGLGQLNLGEVSGIGLEISGGPAAVLPAGGTLRVASLTLGAGAVLDLASRDLIVSTGNLAELTASIASARNAPNGLWSGAGLTTSVATPDTGLGIAALPDGGVLVKYTYTGDADLSGKVDIADFLAIDRGRALRLSGWSNGDFDYSGGPPTADDYMLIDRAFMTQGGALAGLSAPAAAVPEPGGIAAAALLGSPALLRRRRRP
jgi:hypothetical protein